MRATNWRGIAELIGIAAIVASLIFVGMELRQQQQVALNESGFNLVENSRDVRGAFIEHADIWVKGSAGEALDRTEAAIYHELIRIYWAGAYWTATTRAAVGEDHYVSLHDFAGFLHRNPGAHQVWLSSMTIEQDYRQRLLPEPVGVELMGIVLSDLEKLASEPVQE